MHLVLNPKDLRISESGTFGNYRVIRPISQGASCLVYEAEHLHSGLKVALKFIHLGQESQAEERARREAMALAQTCSEHVVSYLDSNRLENGVVWLAMELMETSLHSVE